MEKNFKYKELTHQILNAAFEVHNTIGCGFLEKVYERSIIYELELKGMKGETQKEIRVFYKDKEVGIYAADLVVENKIIVELKAVVEITEIHRAQLLNYLKSSGIEVGLILNFSRPKLEYERLVL